MDVKKYTDEQLEAIEQIAIESMGFIPGKGIKDQPAKVLEYVKMPEEQKINWLTGFGQCLEEAKEEKLKQQQGGQGGSGGGSCNGGELDDGLRHFTSQKPQKSLNQSQSSDNQKQYVPFDDDNDQEEQELEPQSFRDFLNNGGNSPEKLAANKALNAADKALNAADKAQEAADKAQEAADASGSSEAQEAANKALEAANKALEAAYKAQEAADKAADKAQEAQNQKANGNKEAANEAAQEAGEAARDAGQAAQEAGEAAQEAGQFAQDAGAAATEQASQDGNQSGQQAGQQAGQAGQQSGQAGQQADQAGQQADQAGEIAEKSAGQNQNGQNNRSQANELGDPDGELSRVEIDGDLNDLHFNPTDVCGEDGKDNNRRMDECANDAGQGLEKSDNLNVVDYLKKLYELLKNQMSRIGHTAGGGKQRGFGNSLEDVFKQIDELFAPVVDWRSALKRMMNARQNIGKDDAWSRRRFGVGETHPFHKGRYQHPDEITFDKKAGIMQVFILIDNSGSMYTATGHSDDPFTNIMSEIINLEKQTHIENSALSYFGCGTIKKEQVRIWHAKDCKNVKTLVEYLKQRPGDNGGGTDISAAIASLPELGKKYFNQGSSPSKQTLLICISDGYDDYSNLSRVITPSMLQKTIFLICNSSDADLKKTKEILIGQGILDRHIFLVNAAKEW